MQQRGVEGAEQCGTCQPPPRRRAALLERARRRCAHDYFCAARSAFAAFEAADKLTLVGCVQIASTMNPKQALYRARMEELQKVLQAGDSR